jgi:RNA polymerase sigma factor (sigma-70 family)
LQDGTLLRRYVVTGSQDAFRQLMERHMGFVYGACLRETGNESLAEEAVQVVFLVLAQKARRLDRTASLAGWLFATARFACNDIRRQERRRLERERKVAEGMSTSVGSQTDPTWDDLIPALNSAIASLSARDREVIVLRYLEENTIPDVSDQLGISVAAAQQRIIRALSRLRTILRRDGVVFASTSGLAMVLTDGPAQAVPGTCVAAAHRAIEGFAVGGMPASGVSSATSLYVQGVIKSMLAQKLKLFAALLGAGIAATGVGARILGSPPQPTAAPAASATSPGPATPSPAIQSTGQRRMIHVQLKLVALDQNAVNRLNGQLPGGSSTLTVADLTNAGASIEASPSVFTADGVRAKVSITQQRPYTLVTGKTSYQELGLTIDALPTIKPNGLIGLQLTVTRTTPVGTAPPGSPITVNVNTTSASMTIASGRTVCLAQPPDQSHIERFIFATADTMPQR